MKTLNLLSLYGTMRNVGIFLNSTDIKFPAEAGQALPELSRRDKILVESRLYKIISVPDGTKYKFIGQ